MPDAAKVTVWVPLAPKVPVQLGSFPEGVQEVALMVDQVSEVEPPTATVAAPSVRVGTASAVFA